MSGKPRLFLLDAGPVIGLHELGLWHALLDRADVIVPAIVADKEAHFWDDGEGAGRAINLRAEAAAGRLRIAAVGATDVADMLSRFDPPMREKIDPGEAEAITLLCQATDDPPEFCTADHAAVRAACLLGHATLIVSLEEVLRRVGLQRRDLHPKYTEARVRQWIDEGREQRLRGEGLAGS
jgi:hypothetical protein